ncbi:hypothetical protein P154DRAFT_558070 [Amniculicola lignicola CBS 123094]|uniref:Uncharacterized protein n=1 Tax=Amniculicola lignicola CBS 123094 TaxID=1392246 RepID=A0A6A5X423_9PLEO|nr:hypothetical protein P154DRAFT_558070 [Amniculicola lignicola CBS 123094]
MKASNPQATLSSARMYIDFGGELNGSISSNLLLRIRLFTVHKMSLHESQDDPSKPSLAAQAAAGFPLFIPWTAEVVNIGTCFHSSRITSTEGPWAKESAFYWDSSHPFSAVCDLEAGMARVNEVTSSSSRFSQEHMSASLGVTIACPFLSGNVTGFYDKHVTKKGNMERLSKTASLHCGRVILDTAPRLSTAAFTTLVQHGPEKFRDSYGDYYVVGYELGAEAGACLAIDSISTEFMNTTTITVQIKVLFWSATHQITEGIRSHISNFSGTFCGYDTLSGAKWLTESQQVFQIDTAASALQRVTGLEDNVTKAIDSIGLAQGKAITARDCEKICRSGLVLRLILEPFSGLKEYVSKANVAKLAKEREMQWN